MKKIGVIFGGESVEHDISIITALQVINILKKNYKCIPIYINNKGQWFTGNKFLKIDSFLNKKNFGFKKLKVDFNRKSLVCGLKKIKLDFIFNCCHGAYGEDGKLSGIIEMLKIPFSSSHTLSSSLCMDKAFAKIIAEHFNYETPHFHIIFEDQQEEFNYSKIEYPVIVKPCNLGSSVGIEICDDESSLHKAIKNAFNFDKKVLIEQFLVDCREFNCACFKFKNKYYLSNIYEVNKSQFYTFEDKYINVENKTKSNLISKDIIEKIKEQTIKLYSAFECSGIVRIDYLYKDEKVVFNEVNSIPGSLALNLFAQNQDEILDLVMQESIEQFEKNKKINHCYQSNALEIYKEIKNSIKK